MDVEVHPIANRDRIIRLSVTVVPKSRVQLVAVPSGEHEAPEKRWNNRMTKAVYPAFTIAGDYRVRGNLHLPTRPKELQFILTEHVGLFFALTDAQFSLGDEHVDVPLVLVNKDFVSCFDIGQPAPAVNADASELSSFVGSF